MIRMMKSLLLVMLLFYLPVEDSVNSPGSPTFITFWMLVFILGIGLSEKPEIVAIENHEEKIAFLTSQFNEVKSGPGRFTEYLRSLEFENLEIHFSQNKFRGIRPLSTRS